MNSRYNTRNASNSSKKKEEPPKTPVKEPNKRSDRTKNSDSANKNPSNSKDKQKSTNTKKINFDFNNLKINDSGKNVRNTRSSKKYEQEADVEMELETELTRKKRGRASEEVLDKGKHKEKEVSSNKKTQNKNKKEEKANSKNQSAKSTPASKKEAIKKDLDITLISKEDEMELDKNEAYERISSSSEEESKNKKSKNDKKQEPKLNRTSKESNFANNLDNISSNFLNEQLALTNQNLLNYRNDPNNLFNINSILLNSANLIIPNPLNNSGLNAENPIFSLNNNFPLNLNSNPIPAAAGAENQMESAMAKMDNFINSRLLNSFAINTMLNNSIDTSNNLNLMNKSRKNSDFPDNQTDDDFSNFNFKNKENKSDKNLISKEKGFHRKSDKKSSKNFSNVIEDKTSEAQKVETIVDSAALHQKISEIVAAEKQIILKDKTLWQKVNYIEAYFKNENNNFGEILKIENEKTDKEKNKVTNSDSVNKDNLVLTPKDFYLGNFEHFYYNKYLSVFNDERVKYLEAEMIKDRKCLDIGCNNGILTILIALNFQPERIEGIDLDAKLVKRALKNMKYIMRNNLNKDFIDNLFIIGKKDEGCNNILEEIMQNDNNKKISISANNDRKPNCTNVADNLAEKEGKDESEKPTKAIYNQIKHNYNAELANTIKEKLTNNQESKPNKMTEILEKLKSLPQSFLINLGMNRKQNEIDKAEKLETFVNKENKKFPQNLIFKQENYLLELKSGENPNEKYDVIFCLNTAKWMHLNFGDNAIKLLFINVFNQLEEKGYFIFQFQNWKSYKKRKNLSKYIHKTYSEIKLKPEKFEEYLSSTFNFKLVKKISLPNNSKKMYDRPLYVFQKVTF